MSVVALDTAAAHFVGTVAAQKYSPHTRRHDEVISSGYSSQDGDVLLTVATNYLSGEGASTQSSPRHLPGAVQPISSRKISTSQLTHVSDNEGTMSGILLSPHHLQPVRSQGEATRAASTMLSSRKCLTPTCACCQRCEAMFRINEELVQQSRLLEEKNHNLSEEIQVSRRFYQGTLADLTAQLSIAENRIKYLKEVVSTQEEALLSRNQSESDVAQQLSPGSHLTNIEHFSQPLTMPTSSTSNTTNNSTILRLPPQSKNNAHRGNSAAGGYHSGYETVRSNAGSSVGSVTSETSRTRLKNLARMKEQLLEKNQNLKTDIELLKFKTDLPRSVSVPSLIENREIQELPAINGNVHLTGDRRDDLYVGNHLTTNAIERTTRPPTPKKYNIYSQTNCEILPEQKQKVKTRQK